MSAIEHACAALCVRECSCLHHRIIRRCICASLFRDVNSSVTGSAVFAGPALSQSRDAVPANSSGQGADCAGRRVDQDLLAARPGAQARGLGRAREEGQGRAGASARPKSWPSQIRFIHLAASI